MSSATFDMLDYNFPTPFRCLEFIQKPIIFLSNINIDVRDIYISLNAIKIKLHFKPSDLFTKKTRFMSYKYIMKPSNQRFTIFILYCIYIFRASLFRIFLYFLYLKRYLFENQKVSPPSKMIFYKYYL